ncbi:MAG TPA: circularly permuted type 2 ATP-grasp protein [Aggregatilineales bacterium]|nr:circularly permuted type 2 ATP-grasp protein [Anaerolineae bacterium]HUN10167.1 circularly permuted type 2 ATP-grasp protein [Aggregatilineales bacterium]
MPAEAIDLYHSLLNDQLAADTAEALYGMLRPRQLYFGDRPLCTVIRPHFYLLKDWNYFKQETEILLGAFARLHEACMEDSALRQQLDLHAYEEALFSLDKGGPVPWTSSRLDSFFHMQDRNLKFVEYNAETPAGMGYEDVLSEVFMELEPIKRFQKYYAVQSMPMQGKLLVSLMRAYKEWGGEGIPQIAIVDWSSVPTLTEHRIIRDYFERHGVKSILADPRALEYRDGKLWYEDFRIDLIYKRVLASELIQEMGINNPIVRAVKDRAVMLSNSFSCKLLAKKASLALMSDERNANLFTPAQLASIQAHIPWTRRIENRTTFYKDAPVDLVPFISKYKDRFVIKPNDEYGGKGVVLGWEVSQEQFDATLRDALTSTPSVAQERIDLIEREFPAWINERLDISPRYIDANPYVFGGHTVFGCLTRLSSVALLNVTAGGGSVVPTFILQKKD